MKHIYISAEETYKSWGKKKGKKKRKRKPTLRSSYLRFGKETTGQWADLQASSKAL